VAQLLADAGVVAIACLISPYRADRERVREEHRAAGLDFVEVFVDTPVERCEARDPKGMYAKARAGEITGFTGVDDPYEAPERAELVLRPEDGTPTEQAAKIMELLRRDL
jgi:bifunctional enzyme CysN/CysC